MAVEKITDEQAAEALQQLRNQTTDDESDGVPQPAPVEAVPVEPEPVAAAPAPEVVPAESDDVVSLKARAEKAEKQVKDVEERFAARQQAFQQRSEESQRIMRERFLRKATTADRALKILKATRTQDGVAEAEVDRVIREIEETMNPASSSYVAPQPTPAATEDQALALNSFLNEKGMTIPEADEFGKWVRNEAQTAMSPTEQAVIGQSLDGFLRLAHTRWQEGMKTKEERRGDAVAAVKSVQRTQQAAARAASASPAAPRKEPAGGKPEVDYKKITKDDLSALLRASVEQARGY